jgi:hypothetical protein
MSRHRSSPHALRRVALVVLCCSVPAALSQPLPKAATLDPVVVTAARGPQSLDDLVADVTSSAPRRSRGARRSPRLAALAPASARDRHQRQPRLDVGGSSA